MKKTLIFDFDGTIADSFELVLRIAEEITGIAKPSDEELAQLRHSPLNKVVFELHIPPWRLPSLFLLGRQKMHEHINEVKPFKGIAEVLDTLHGQGHHLLVMSSNSEQNVRAFLRANNLESYFDGVYGGAGIFSKAGALRKVIKNNRLEARNCYYVGDEMRDVVAASKVHVEPIAVTWGYQARDALEKYHPFALVDTPAQLLNIFKDNKA